MTMLEGLYTSGLRLIRPILPFAGAGDGKLAVGIRGRAGAVEHLAGWARRERDSTIPLVWFHAPSVGEGLQARAVMEALRSLCTQLQVAYTYFSPSAVPLAQRLPADVTGYLPMDLPGDVRRTLDALEPDAIVFTKTEVWPNLTRAASERRIPLLLLSATLPVTSSRLRLPARSLLSPSHRRLDCVGAISSADAKRFQQLGARPEAIHVTGDARFDQVLRRARAVDRSSGLLRSLRPARGLTLVAGSTWPADQAQLVPAVRGSVGNGNLRMIIAPHEPTEAHLTELEALLTQSSLRSIRLAEVEAQGSDADVIIIDRVGILGDLYALADVAYVGGGFGSAGIHSVLEPAAFGAPVTFGVHNSNSREAGELVRLGGAFEARDTAELARRLRSLLEDETLRRQAGAIARDYVESGLGAAERSARLIMGLMDRERGDFAVGGTRS